MHLGTSFNSFTPVENLRNSVWTREDRNTTISLQHYNVFQPGIWSARSISSSDIDVVNSKNSSRFTSPPFFSSNGGSSFLSEKVEDLKLDDDLGFDPFFYPADALQKIIAEQRASFQKVAPVKYVSHSTQKQQVPTNSPPGFGSIAFSSSQQPLASPSFEPTRNATSSRMSPVVNLSNFNSLTRRNPSIARYRQPLSSNSVANGFTPQRRRIAKTVQVFHKLPSRPAPTSQHMPSQRLENLPILPQQHVATQEQNLSLDCTDLAKQRIQAQQSPPSDSVPLAPPPLPPHPPEVVPSVSLPPPPPPPGHVPLMPEEFPENTIVSPLLKTPVPPAVMPETFHAESAFENEPNMEDSINKQIPREELKQPSLNQVAQVNGEEKLISDEEKITLQDDAVTNPEWNAIFGESEKVLDVLKFIESVRYGKISLDELKRRAKDACQLLDIVIEAKDDGDPTTLQDDAVANPECNATLPESEEVSKYLESAQVEVERENRELLKTICAWKKRMVKEWPEFLEGLKIAYEAQEDFNPIPRLAEFMATHATAFALDLSKCCCSSEKKFAVLNMFNWISRGQ